MDFYKTELNARQTKIISNQQHYYSKTEANNMINKDTRPDPDILLKQYHEEPLTLRGKLKIFLGYAAGVGKTYAMLDEAHQQMDSGVNVLVGYIEPHTRPETTSLLNGLVVLPPRELEYKNIRLKEFDLDEALRQKPQVILVDELAHTNAPGVRNKKRYQDVEELLNAGIDVYTTVNVQHIESLNDVIQDITNIFVRETFPDYIFDNADIVMLIDIEPDELLKRLADGKIYRTDRAAAAMENFFTKEKLRLLREIALRKTADRVSHGSKNKNAASDVISEIKFLVCISPAPSSAKCIRWAARNAEAFHASWTVAYVETAEGFDSSEKMKKALQANLELAERMGAEIVTLAGYDAASAIAEYAKLSGITNIVIGKTRKRKNLMNYFKTNFEDKLILLLDETEIHIISDSSSSKTYRKTFRNSLTSSIVLSWGDTIIMFLLLIGATLISLGLRKLGINDRIIIMVYLLSVLIISRTTSGYFYGISSAVLCALTFNFLFIEPYYTFSIIQEGYLFTFLIMMMVALITSALTARIKTQVKLATERERRTEILYEINKKLLATRGMKNIVDLTNDYLINIFNRSSIIYTKDPAVEKIPFFKQSPNDPDSSYMTSDDEQAVAHWVFVNQKKAGCGTDTLMGAGAFYLPVISQKKVLGVIGISCANQKALSQNSRFILRMLASQLAMALERQNLSDEQRNIQVESEKEKMRGNLLRAISHDLRTPLTGILGASSAILESGELLDKITRNKLIYGIKEDSQWLIRMVENLLSVTRINEGTMNVTKMPEAVEEIVSEAINRIKARMPDSEISVKVPDELLVVPMDGTLIEQVLINLIENAIKHSGKNTLVSVTVKKNNNDAVFEVSDNGYGIPESELPYIFDVISAKVNRSTDSSRGIGIGLSICMSIINAHRGKMEALNKDDGGAIFRFSLPIKENADEK